VPAVLAARAGLDAHDIGHLVSAGGVIGTICILFAGWNSDRHGDRFRDAFVGVIIYAAGILLIGVAATRALVILGYLLFAVAWFPAFVLIASSWADVLHVRQLAVGAAAINTAWQIGAFLSPYGWGLAKDATGSFEAGLIGASVLAGASALLILYVRARVMLERRGRAAALQGGVIPGGSSCAAAPESGDPRRAI
jgi:ACS family tartrate transporter-like MFS transporter